MDSHRFTTKTESRCFLRLSMGSCDSRFGLAAEVKNSPFSAFRPATSFRAFSIETPKLGLEEGPAMRKR